MSDDLRKRRIQKLWEDGLALLEAEAYEDALKVGAQLEAERFSGAFDLAARALVALGRVDEAILTLERGVQLAPSAWLNWQLLGNCRSDARRYDEAAEAYTGALGCPDVWIDSVRLNQAILAERRGSPRAALETLDQVEDPGLALHKADVRARLLLAVSENQAAVEEATRVSCPDEPTPFERGCLARLCCSHATALVNQGEPPAIVRELLLRTIVTYPESDELLSLLRRLRNQVSEQACLFAVTVSYDLAGTQLDSAGFVRVGRVIADAPQEALSILREVEGMPALALDGAPEVRLLEETPGALKGVLSLTGRHYYAARE